LRAIDRSFERDAMKLVATLVGLTGLAVLTTGCAGVGDIAGATEPTLPMTGDQKGGKIPNGFSNVPAAMRTAEVHCAKYRKRALLTQMNAASAGGLVEFVCL
jgi:hypothetical protein